MPPHAPLAPSKPRHQHPWWHRGLALCVALFLSYQSLARKDPARRSAGAALSRRSKVPTRLQGHLNIHKANAAQWQRLPGIGPKLAARILDRRKRRAFTQISQLQEVRGIGPAFMRRFASHLRTQGPSDLRLVPVQQSP